MDKMDKELFIKGLQNKDKGKNFDDGSLHDIINLRVKDGNWVGVHKKEPFFDLGQNAKSFHVHDLGLDGIGIAYVYDVGQTQTIAIKLLDFSGEEIGGQELLTNISTDKTITLSSLNNILLVNGLGTIGYYVYESDKDLYRFIPPMPEPLVVSPYYPELTKVSRINGVAYGGAIDLDFVCGVSPYDILKTPDHTAYDQEKLRRHFWANGYDILEEELIDHQGPRDDGAAYAMFQSLMESGINDALREMYDDGLLVGEFYAVFAYKLYDGSIIKPTVPIKLKQADLFIFDDQITGLADEHLITSFIYSMSRDLRVMFDMDQINAIHQDHKGIITGIEMYISPLQNYYTEGKLINDFPGEQPTDENGDRIEKIKLIRDEINIKNIDNMYYLLSITIEDVIKNPDYFTLKPTLKSPDQLLVSQPVMGVDDFTHHAIEALGESFTYNSRILLPQLRNNYFNGFSFDVNRNMHLLSSSIIEGRARDGFSFHKPFYGNTIAVTPYSYGIEITINVDGESKRIFSGWKDSNVWTRINNNMDFFEWEQLNDFETAYVIPLHFSPQFIYPDSRATQVKFLVRMNDGDLDGLIWSKTRSLTPHDFMNLSYSEVLSGRSSQPYAFEEDNTYGDDENYNIVQLVMPQRVVSEDIEFWHPSSLTYPVGKTQLTHQPFMDLELNWEEPGDFVKIDHNRIQVSELNNPFVFPAEKSYRVGNGSILSIANVTQEFSEGQFGQFPIIVFTDDGIWALEIGMGETFVSNVVPVAKDTTNNPDSVTVVRDGIFFSSDTGLKILQGKQSIKVSDEIEGSIAIPIGVDRVITHILTEEGQETGLTTTEFKEYIKNCIIGYDRTNEEMIISNPDYQYSYVYMFNSKLWSKHSESFTRFFNAFPFTLGQKGSVLYDTSKEDDEDNNYMILTNPIEFEPDRFTKLREMIIRGRHDQSKIRLFGSTDGIDYKLISSLDVTRMVQDIHIKRVNYSCKSYVLFIIGDITNSSYINRIEANVNQKFRNKLR